MTYKFDFVKHRIIYILIAVFISIAGMVSLYVQGLNLGIDFVSGSRVDITVGDNNNLEKGKEVLTELGYTNPNVRIGGRNQDIIIFRTDQVLNQQQVEEIQVKFSESFQTETQVQEQVVDPIIGRELAKNAIYSLLLAAIGIGLYIAFRFEFRFAIAVILTVLFDAFFTISVFSLFQFEVDIIFVAAVLTVVGYSINDTIVIFDRIRENLKQTKEKISLEQLSQVVNVSINQTLVRSINTGITIIFAVVSLYVIGGESIRYFSLALLFGLLSAIYSSIFLAAQIWILLKRASIKNVQTDTNQQSK